ncbi:ABC transporter permease [Virgibacillus sp. NKC19-3]|uniref:ABC transporter permease n=1 Tax=Virgibacillus saliphilus TaxID=2831674 RepID=UPI001C9A979D|nr:ABC transporter permease [Virgibacillus sp. NKC19-3]MBY7141931.1 ABC transporter permease [Virgibacillus sp. NKC19-3]
MKKMVISDVLKSKRTVLGLVLFLVPALTILYEIANFLFRSETLTSQANDQNTDMWHMLLYDKQAFLCLAIPIGITVAASVISNIEHQADAWKQTFTLPISRIKVFFSKFLLLFSGSLLSGVLLMVGMFLFGTMFNFNTEIPWVKIIGDSFFPYIAAIPIMAIQLWLSLMIKNQAFSIAIGAISTMGGLFFALSPVTQWLPWAYPLNASTVRMDYSSETLMLNPDLWMVLFLSCLLGLILLSLGGRVFSQKEVQ